MIFLILVTYKNKTTSASFLRQKNPLTIAISFAVLEQSKVILSQAGRAKPVFLKEIHFLKSWDILRTLLVRLGKRKH